MSAVSDVMAAAQAAQTQTTSEVNNSKNKTAVRGKTIGKPQLSEKAAKYYDELRRKYSDKEFILVSEDQKATAQAQAGRYANANKMVVLIDEDKIERMAEDAAYREKYESIIANASNGLSQLKNSLAGTGANVKGFGMQVKDNGMTSFFAVLDKSSAAQKTRIEKKAAEKKEAKKAEAKKAAKKEREERLEKNRASRAEKAEAYRPGDEDTITITANSMEELIQKIKEATQGDINSVQTDAEKMIGQSFDYSI